MKFLEKLAAIERFYDIIIKIRKQVVSMKIVLMEPLGISGETLDSMAASLKAAGHDFTSYDSFSLGVE